MALAIDASSPAIVSGAGPTVTTASFTPPAGSILLIGAAMDGLTPASGPSITDNLGSHLTYTRTDWQNGNGQAAMWWAPVSSSTAMTVSVTNGETSAGAQTTAAKVWVLTGADTVSEPGAHGPGSSSSAASIAQSYTAQATSGWGFIVVSDFDQKGAETAGTGCTSDGSANVGTAITYGMMRRTTADDVNGNSNTLNVTLPGTSTNLRWCYAEVKPAAASGSSTTPQPLVVAVPPPRAPTTQAILTRGGLANPPVLTTASPMVVALPPPLQLPATPVVLRNTLVDPANPVPIVVSSPWLRTLPPPVTVSRGDLVDPPVLTTPGPLVVAHHPRALLPPAGAQLRASLADVVAPAVPTPAPIVAGLGTPWPPPPQIWTLRPARTDPPVLTTPAALVTQLPGTPAPIPLAVVVRSTLLDPANPVPIVALPPAVRPVITPAVISRTAPAGALTFTAPLVTTWTWRPDRITAAVLARASLADGAAPPVVSAPGRLTSTTTAAAVTATSSTGSGTATSTTALLSSTSGGDE